MASYTIAFDIPEDEVAVFTFASTVFPSSTTTLTPSLDNSTRFESESQAYAFLASDNVPFSLRAFGAVVEVAS